MLEIGSRVRLRVLLNLGLVNRTPFGQHLLNGNFPSLFSTTGDVGRFISCRHSTTCSPNPRASDRCNRAHQARSLLSSPTPRVGRTISATNVSSSARMASVAGTVRSVSSTIPRDMPWGGITARSPEFTQNIVKVMQELFPLELADRSWDNVGLLLDNIETPDNPHRGRPRILLTNDLTYQVAEEAVAWGASIIISYHPIIFRPLKSITTADPQQATLLLLASNRIAVYSPHTALDGSPQGINAWLADNAIYAAKQTTSPGEKVKVSKRHVLRPVPDPSGKEVVAAEGPQTGYGVIAHFDTDVPAQRIVKGVARLLGGLRHLAVAEPIGCDLALNGGHAPMVTSVAVCAGSGGDVLRNCEAQLWITGEMSHHDALAATQRGKIVVTTFHSNTERRFLEFKLKPMLEDRLVEEYESVKVVVSRWDRDPFRTFEVERS